MLFIMLNNALNKRVNNGLKRCFFIRFDNAFNKHIKSGLEDASHQVQQCPR